VGRRNGKRRWVREKCGRQEAAGLRSRVPRRKRKPLLRAKTEAQGRREKKRERGEREREREKRREREREIHSRLAGCAVALPTTVRGEERSSGSAAEKERGQGLKRAFIAGRTS